jgi:hypothetical protein
VEEMGQRREAEERSAEAEVPGNHRSQSTFGDKHNFTFKLTLFPTANIVRKTDC